jgi:hypothetical protein
MPLTKEKLQTLRELVEVNGTGELLIDDIIELLDEVTRLRTRVYAAAAGKCMECGKVLDLNYIDCCRRRVHVHTPDCTCDV